MDLRQNIIDSVKECEIKLGYREEAISLYYPESVLLELLSATEETLPKAILEFCASASGEFGKVSIMETNESGRYQINIPKEGVAFVHENVETSSFVKDFVETIHRPGMTKEAIITLFQKYSDGVVVEQAGKKEWAVYFSDPQIDAYVYYIEEDDFGLQYHRFTKESYEVIKKIEDKT